MAKIRITNAQICQGFNVGQEVNVSASIANRLVTAGGAVYVGGAPPADDRQGSFPTPPSAFGRSTAMVGPAHPPGAGELLRGKLKQG